MGFGIPPPPGGGLPPPDHIREIERQLKELALGAATDVSKLDAEQKDLRDEVKDLKQKLKEEEKARKRDRERDDSRHERRIQRLESRDYHANTQRLMVEDRARAKIYQAYRDSTSSFGSYPGNAQLLITDGSGRGPRYYRHSSHMYY